MVRPDAPIGAQARSVRLCNALFCVLGLLVVANTAFAQDERTSFDIPAQSLIMALETFSAATGYQILMADAAGTAQSTAVRGVLSPREALDQMISGTGLEVRFTGARAAVLVRDARSQHASTLAPSRRELERYDVAFQNAVLLSLCRDAATRPGTYRAALDLWVSSSGGVAHAELLSSTGDTDRDRRIVAALHALSLPPPPPDLKQPTTLLLLPLAPDDSRTCDAAPAAQRAKAQ